MLANLKNDYILQQACDIISTGLHTYKYAG